MIAILGGLGAATLWAAATLSSSRSSRILGSRVVLGWVMLFGAVVGLPLAIASPIPDRIEPTTVGLVLLAGVCYVVGLGLVYATLQIGKVSIVAPITATEGAGPRWSPSSRATRSDWSRARCWCSSPSAWFSRRSTASPRTSRPATSISSPTPSTARLHRRR